MNKGLSRTTNLATDLLHLSPSQELDLEVELAPAVTVMEVLQVLVMVATNLLLDQAVVLKLPLNGDGLWLTEFKMVFSQLH